MNKKKVFVAGLLIFAIAIVSMGSLAWFSDNDSVTNTFKFATDEDDDIDFSIDVFETDPTGTGGKTDDGLTFEDVLPGVEYAKDPTVKNTGAYDEYARVKVTVTDAAAWKAACAKYEITDLTEIFGGYEDSKWVRGEIIDNATDDTLTYVYYLNRVLGPGSDEKLFTSVTIPGEFTQEDVKDMAEFTLTVDAEALQADGFPADANVTDAQSAFAFFDGLSD